MKFRFRKKNKGLGAERSIRQKKKYQQEKKADAEAAAAARTNRNNKKDKVPPHRKGSTRARSKVSFRSPLNTIEEVHEPTTGETLAETPPTKISILKSINVFSQDSPIAETGDEGLEIFYGSSSAPSADNSENEALEVVYGEEGAVRSFADGVRKQLFVEEQEPVVKEEEPFDQYKEYHGKEDPAIRDLSLLDEEDDEEEEVLTTKIIIVPVEKKKTDNEEIKKVDGKDKEERDQAEGAEATAIEETEKPFPMIAAPREAPKRDLQTNAARDLFDTAFNCNPITDGKAGRLAAFSMFYDTMCGPGDANVRGKRRPYFDKELALSFIKEASSVGVPLLQHIAPDDPTKATADWTGRSITMFIRFGDLKGSSLVQPRLEWVKMGGGLNFDVSKDSVNLLDISAISDSSAAEEEGRDDEELIDEVCFFSITNNKGDVFLFEASTADERDRIVDGIRNVIARLSFQVVVGDTTACTELYSADYDDSAGDLPSCRTPHQDMNGVSHAFLDNGGRRMAQPSVALSGVNASF